MNERLLRCPACPERGRVSKALAKLCQVAPPADCNGPQVVSRGEVTTQTRAWGEPSPPTDTWNVVMGPTGGEQRYSRIDWQTETVCGRNPVESREGEVPFLAVEGSNSWVDEGGQRHTAFIHGTEQEVNDALGTLSVARMLDSRE